MAVSYGAYRSVYRSWVANVSVLAGADPSVAMVAAVASHTIFLTHLSVSVTTDNAATLTFRDTASTPVVMAKTPANPGLGLQEWNFGQEGIPLTEGKGLDLLASAAGLAGVVHAEGYYKQTAVIVA